GIANRISRGIYTKIQKQLEISHPSNVGLRPRFTTKIENSIPRTIAADRKILDKYAPMGGLSILRPAAILITKRSDCLIEKKLVIVVTAATGLKFGLEQFMSGLRQLLHQGLEQFMSGLRQLLHQGLEQFMSGLRQLLHQGLEQFMSGL
ncbi:hypothetical protein L9F63_001423, partial [Diploptera punctata]